MMSKLLFRKGILVAFLVFSTMSASAQNLLIESLSGPITQNEIDAFKVYMQKLIPPATPWGALDGTGHNAWADYEGGNVIEAYGLMYEATGDITLLNSMIHWTDICVSQRNDLLPAIKGGQRVLWTGKINKVWVPNYPASTSAGYVGGEDGDTKAHIAYCALVILKNPSIWDLTIPDGNPYNYGVTYLDRAKDYMAKCDESNDDYTRVQFAQAGTNLIRNPSNWPSGYHTMEAVNIQMMLDGDFQRMAECHEILGDAPDRVTQYDAIVKASMVECINGMATCHSTQVNGKNVYAWGYYPWDKYPSHIETVGHAAYDMVGVYRAFNRPIYGFSPALVTPFANALSNVMSLGNNSFSTNVDGSGSTQNYMQAQWLPLGDWEPNAYNLVATANLASTRYKSTPLMTATMLWMKNRRYQPIAAPSNLTASVASNNRLYLSWTDRSINEIKFYIEKSSDGSVWTLQDSLTANATTYSYLDANATTTYYYRVRAANLSGVSGYSNIVNNLRPTVPPTSPSNLTAIAISNSQINLTWADNSNNESGFQIEQSSNGVNWNTLSTTNVNSTNYSIVGLNSFSTYYFRIRAENAYGNSDFTEAVSCITFDNPAIAPDNLSALATSDSQINLSWIDNSNNETGFKIERSFDGSTNWNLLTTVSANTTSYSNTGLDASLMHYYRILASNSGGNSAYSGIASATTLNSANPPLEPSGLTGTATNNQVSLSWTDHSHNETLFRIERSPDGVENWSSIGTVSTNVNHFTNTGLTPSTLYYYRIRSENPAGNSSYTAIYSTTTTASTSNITLNKTATASNIYKNNTAYAGSYAVDGSLSSRWACDDGITSATLEVDLGGFYTFGQAVTLDYLSRVTSYLIQFWNGYKWVDAFTGTAFGSTAKTDNFNAVTGSKVRLNIFTTNAKGPSIYEFSVYGYPSSVDIPAAPTALSTSVQFSSEFDLEWVDNSSNEILFQIESSTDGSSWLPLATVDANTTSYTVTGFSSGIEYSYRVRAVNAGGNSTYSNIVTYSDATGIKETKKDQSTVQLITASDHTNMTYTLSSVEDVTIDVYTISGQKMKTVLHERQEAGTHHLLLNHSDFANGLYLLYFSAGNDKIIRKWIVAK